MDKSDIDKIIDDFDYELKLGDKFEQVVKKLKYQLGFKIRIAEEVHKESIMVARSILRSVLEDYVKRRKTIQSSEQG